MQYITDCCYQVKSQYFHRLAAQKRGLSVLVTELMFNEAQNNPGLLPRWWTEFLSSFVTKPSLHYLCPKIQITKRGQFDHKDKSANVGACRVKISVPQQLRATTTLEILLLLFNMIQQPQFTHQRVQGLHTIEICAWTAGSWDLPGFSPSAAAAQLPTEEPSQPCHSPAVICERGTRSLPSGLSCRMLWEAMGYFFPPPHKRPAPAMLYLTFHLAKF